MLKEEQYEHGMLPATTSISHRVLRVNSCIRCSNPLLLSWQRRVSRDSVGVVGRGGRRSAHGEGPPAAKNSQKIDEYLRFLLHSILANIFSHELLLSLVVVVVVVVCAAEHLLKDREGLVVAR